MHLNVPLPEGVSLTEAARISRAVSSALESHCGFIAEPQLVTSRPLALSEEGMGGFLAVIDAVLTLQAEPSTLRGLRDWIRAELQGSKP